MLELWEPLGPGSPGGHSYRAWVVSGCLEEAALAPCWEQHSTSNEPGTVGYFFRASSKAPSRRACRIHPLLLVVVGGGSELDCLLATSGPAELIGMSQQVQGSSQAISDVSLRVLRG